MRDPPDANLRRWDPVVVAILCGAGLYVAWLVDRGWIPHDDGMLAQAAERVLQGERPHVDFQDPYTGLLSYWNALAFRVFGIRLVSLRAMLFLSFLPFFGALFALLRRFLRPRGAALAAAGAAVWCLPGYPAAMPTWYNLFLAVVALLAFVRFLESGRTSWLFAAGLVSGVSVLFKVVGVYSLAGLLLALMLCRPWIDSGKSVGVGPSRWNAGLVSVGAVVYSVLLTRLVWGGQVSPAHVFHYLLPGLSLLLGIVLVTWALPGGRALPALPFLRQVAILLTGFALPLLVFTASYVPSGALADLWEGVVLLPQRRFAFASGAPFPLRRLLPALPGVLLLVAAMVAPGRWRLGASWALGGVLVCALALGRWDPVFGAVWYAARALPTLLVMVGLLLIVLSARGGFDPGDRGPVVPVAAATFAMLGTFSMVQFPFTGPVYFFYVAPLLSLGGVACVALARPSARLPAAWTLAFFAAFGLLWVNHGSILGLGAGRFEARAETERLALDRGGIRVTAEDKAVYEELVSTMRALSTSPATFATPDSPEVYFLSGLRNPTPVFYDFFAEPSGRTERILQSLEEGGVNVVVLNTALHFSPAPARELIGELEGRYGSARMVGPFIVRWK